MDGDADERVCGSAAGAGISAAVTDGDVGTNGLVRPFMQAEVKPQPASLVSATSFVVKSEPPSESMTPAPQPICVTLVVKLSAGTQKFGLLKPPGNGTTVWWMQSASPAPTC